MLFLLEQGKPRESRVYQSSQAVKDWNIFRPEDVLLKGGRHDGTSLDELIASRYGDLRRISLEWAVWSETSVSHKWLAERLDLKSPANSSRQIRRFAKMDEKDIPKPIHKWEKMRNVDCPRD